MCKFYIELQFWVKGVFMCCMFPFAMLWVLLVDVPIRVAKDYDWKWRK